MWTACQLAEPFSGVAAGVRADVSQPPSWGYSKIIKHVESAGLMEKGFCNSFALNVYHDGSEGLA